VKKEPRQKSANADLRKLPLIDLHPLKITTQHLFQSLVIQCGETVTFQIGVKAKARTDSNSNDPKNRDYYRMYYPKKTLKSDLYSLIQNIQHRAMLKSDYGLWMRRSELLNLKPQKISTQAEECFRVNQGKGKKEPHDSLSVEKILELLGSYYRSMRSRCCVFIWKVQKLQAEKVTVKEVCKKVLKSATVS